MKILIIDDELINDTLKKWLGKILPEAEIHQGYSLQEGLTLAKQNKYNLCMLDIEMPETPAGKINPLAGFDLCKKIYTTSTCHIYICYLPKILYMT